MSAANRSTPRHVSMLTGLLVVLGGAAWGLLQLLQSTLPSFHLRSQPELLITLTVGVVAVAIAQSQSAAAKRAARRDAEAELDASLACWWPRTAADLSPYDLGAHPTGVPGATPKTVVPRYVGRAVDGALREALRRPGVVVLYGPPRAGKSRTAYEAVKGVCRGARVLVPEDADGLATVLARFDPLRSIVGGPYVLWLDGLERFLPGVDVDALDRLASEDGGLRVMATIGHDELTALLAEGAGADPLQHRARRLLARARAIPLPAPDASERQDLATAAAGTGSLPARLADGWPRLDVPPAPPPKRPRSLELPAVAALGALALALATWTLLSGFGDGWTTPPPLKDQLATIEGQGDGCEIRSASPPDVAPIEQDHRVMLAIVAQRQACLDSDRLRLYRDRADRLRPFTTLQPAGPRQELTCVGGTPGDRCAIELAGARLLVVAFGDAAGHQAVPFALSPLAERLRLVPLSPHPPARDARVRAGVLRRDLRDVALRFGRASGDGPDASCDPSDCVRGYPAEAWAAFPPASGNDAVIVAGYLAEGSPDAPRALRVQARQLLLRQSAVEVGRPCAIFRRGKPVRFDVGVKAGEDPSAALARVWRAEQARPDSGVVC